MNDQVEGAWELLSGQPLPEGARDIKILSGGRFVFVAFDTRSGKPLYTAGGTYSLDGNAYTERMEFASERISDLIGKDQSFTVEVREDMLKQQGTLTNGQPLKEEFRRIG